MTNENHSNTIKYTYIRGSKLNNTRRVITVARRWKEDTADIIEYQFAVCNPKDTFSKKLGRTIANGRLETAAYAITVTEGQHPEDEVISALSHHPCFTNLTQGDIAMWLYSRACSRLDREAAVIPNCS